VHETAKTLISVGGLLTRKDGVALGVHLHDHIGNRIVQAPVQRAEFVDAEGLVALSGQVGNCLVKVAIPANDLVH
jgi:hypothetical protein